MNDIKINFGLVIFCFTLKKILSQNMGMVSKFYFQSYGREVWEKSWKKKIKIG